MKILKYKQLAVYVYYQLLKYNQLAVYVLHGLHDQFNGV